MDYFIEALSSGFAMLLDPWVLLAVFLGTMGGIIFGALPGVGLPMAFAIILPFTFVMSVEVAVALLMSIMAGLMFGNGMPAILLGVPGTPASILTAIDGYAMRRSGKASLAMATMVFSSSIGQFISAIFFVAAVIPLINLAYNFLQPEMFALYLFSVIAITSLTGKNFKKGLIAAALGMLVGMVGTDPILNFPRFTFGNYELMGGFTSTVVLIGVLAVGEIFRQMRQVFDWSSGSRSTAKLKWPKPRNSSQL